MVFHKSSQNSATIWMASPEQPLQFLSLLRSVRVQDAPCQVIKDKPMSCNRLLRIRIALLPDVLKAGPKLESSMHPSQELLQHSILISVLLKQN